MTAGAVALTGRTREGTSVTPTVLVDAGEACAVNTEEIFGPVLTIALVESVDEAFQRINASRYGLQAGVLTHDIALAFRAAALEVGGVIIGDVPSYRADQMPYGGIKDSGTGREGLRAAMEDFTEPRVVVSPASPCERSSPARAAPLGSLRSGTSGYRWRKRAFREWFDPAEVCGSPHLEYNLACVGALLCADERGAEFWQRELIGDRQ